MSNKIVLQRNLFHDIAMKPWSFTSILHFFLKYSKLKTTSARIFYFRINSGTRRLLKLTSVVSMTQKKIRTDLS